MEVRNSLWIRSRGDAHANLRKAMVSSVIHSFSVEGAIYDLSIYPAAVGSDALDFTWVRRGCNLVPPLEGTLVVRRLGPLTTLTLCGCYRIGDDVASRIAQQLVGRSAAQRSIGYAARAFAKLVAPHSDVTPERRRVA